jgi:hypothetical protein
MVLAFCVLVAGCRVEGEVEFLVQLVEQFLRSLSIVLVRGHGGRARRVKVAHSSVAFPCIALTASRMAS